MTTHFIFLSKSNKINRRKKDWLNFWILIIAKGFLFPVLEIKVLKKVYELKYSPKIVYIYLFLEVPKFVTTLFWCEVSTDILFPGCFVCLGLVVISADLLRKTSQKQSGETSTTWYSSLFIIIICILHKFTQCYKTRKKNPRNIRRITSLKC